MQSGHGGQHPNHPFEIEPESGLPIRHAASGFVYRDGKILLLKRAPSMHRHPNLWAGAAGIIEADESPQEAAIRELFEETALTVTEVEKTGDPVRVVTEGTVWMIHPFRFAAKGEVRLDSENTEFIWIEPDQILTLDAVPDLQLVWASVAP